VWNCSLFYVKTCFAACCSCSCSVWQFVAVCFSVRLLLVVYKDLIFSVLQLQTQLQLQCVAVRFFVLYEDVFCCVLQLQFVAVAVCCHVLPLQCVAVAVCGSMFQCESVL